MTSLLLPPGRTGSDDEHRRPLVLATTLGGAAAAGATLLVCLALGVVGWFLADAGAHGTASDGLRVGAVAWLTGHGAGLVVRGAPVTMVPLGLTLLAGWATWRAAHRVGNAVSGHGPDADRIADGERDLTVPVGIALFAGGYLLVTVVAATLVATGGAGTSTASAVLGSLALAVLVGGPALAVGSGRAAVWLPLLGVQARAAGRSAAGIVLAHLGVAAMLLLVALVLGFGEAATILARLRLDAGEAATLLTVLVAVVPNAVVFAGAWLLGPGFTVGTGTLVSPGLVATGDLPLVPLLAALPDDGTGQWWATGLTALPFLAAAVVTVLVQRGCPVRRWDVGLLRGLAGGVLAGIVVGTLAVLAGGAVGPGRMADVGPLSFEVLVHAVTGFGLGGLLGGVVATWWQRRLAAGATAQPPR